MNMIRPQRRPPRIALSDFEEMLFHRPEEEKWELIDGRIIKSMVGARWEHKQIVVNLLVGLTNHLRKKGSGCRAFDETFWVKDEPNEFAAFPDVVVFGGKLEAGQTSVDAPLIVIEVMSPGTAANDRMIKRFAYQRLPALQVYVLVERDQPFIEVYRRHADGFHGEPQLEGLDAILRLPEIAFEVSLADIYREVIAGDEG